MSDLDELYQQALISELGPYREETNKVREPIYTGELGFALQTQCVKPDIPPGSGGDGFYYRFIIERLDHDTLILILTQLRDILSVEFCTKEMDPVCFGTKKGKLHKELDALRISHMGKWVTACRDKTYTFSIRHIRHIVCTKICKALFSW